MSKVRHRQSFFFVGYVNLIFILGILDGDTEFENSEEIYEAIGHILHEIASEKSEDDIKFVFSFL